MIYFTDTHTHLYLEEFDIDRQEVVEKCLEFGVNKLILPCVDETSILPLQQMLHDYPDICHGAMGLHPTSVDNNYEKQLEVIHKELIDNAKDYIAIGEIGMDLYWNKTYRQQQEIVLREQFDWAVALNMPVIIHCRNAEEEIINIVGDAKYRDLRGVFHCWSGNMEQTERILEMDFYIGIGGTVTYKNSKLPEILLQVPTNRILLETDSPYLSPMPYRGKRNDSGNIIIIAQKISEIKKMALKELSEQIKINVKRLFGI